MAKLSCGLQCYSHEPDINGTVEYHRLLAEEKCREPKHPHCFLHGGIHYKAPVFNGIITSLTDGSENG